MRCQYSPILTFLGTSGGQNIYVRVRGNDLSLAVEKGRIKTALGELPFISIESVH